MPSDGTAALAKAVRVLSFAAFGLVALIAADPFSNRYLRWLMAVSVALYCALRFVLWRCDVRGASTYAAALLAVIPLLYLGTAPSYDDLLDEGGGMVAKLHEYKRKAGVYPDSLDDANLRASWNRYGGWRYETREGGGVFRLRVGEYGLDGFTISYASDRDSGWYIDS